jgi:DNA repair protein RecO (recombination protein O)
LGHNDTAGRCVPFYSLDTGGLGALLGAMEWSDDGIVLGLRPFGENDAIVEALTRGHGRHLGLVRGARSKRLKGALEPGNSVKLAWRGRLDQQLGGYVVELEQARAAHFFDDALKLAGLGAACGVCAALLPERELHLRVYEALEAMLASVSEQASPLWCQDYVRFELVLLEDLGFGLDLSQCAATGEAKDLRFVSPKTGRAVSAVAAEPYRDRLLKLPRFLTPEDGAADLNDVVDGLALTGFFLERVALEHGASMPQARARFAERLAGLRPGR